MDEIRTPPDGRTAARPDAALAVEDLTIRYGHVEAVRDATFAVAPGEAFALLGPNGAGKTTILRVLTTLIRPASGYAHVLGCDVARAPGTIRRLIGYVPQALSADGSLTGRENATLFARLYRVPRRQTRARVQELLDLMGLGQVADELVRTYSGGMVRRLEIAAALLATPRVLLLDEPTLGLDPIARRGIWDHLHAVRRETGMTLFTTTHYLEEAEEHCDRVAVMSAGRVLAAGTVDELRGAVGRADGTLEDVFVAVAGARPESRGGLREVSRVRRTGRRLG